MFPVLKYCILGHVHMNMVKTKVFSMRFGRSSNRSSKNTTFLKTQARVKNFRERRFRCDVVMRAVISVV